MTYDRSLTFAQQLDQNDPLRHFRERFHIPQRNGKPLTYLCGNSLGLQPKSARAALEQELATWQHLGVEGWFDKPESGEQPWLGYHTTCKEALSELVGAEPSEVCPMNALTVNLHLLLTSFYRPTGKKVKILTIKGDFPSDQYALETHIKHRGLSVDDVLVEIAPHPDDNLIHTTDIQRAIIEQADSLALIWMSGLNYYTGQVYNMATLAETAQKHCIPIGFDLAHAIGNIPLRLHDWGVDFATWCSYKYLNGGPGAVSGVFIHQKHHEQNLPRLAGWWGYREDRRFEMTPGFLPEHGADGWQVSTPNILALALHRAAISITAEAGIAALRQKSEHLTGYLEYLLTPFNDILILTPDDPNQRGCQLSLLVRKQGKSLFNYLTEQGIIGDWREPDCIRLAPTPLYNTFEDVWRVGDVLARFFQQ
ncbi:MULTISPECIES: kynureninase [unclassified Spirosoma]|uniref:kynureninase n=1 Tax=unclassified Spirosoma TaxID=2621999 RepID=UPI0009617826|nr:MULTISPECIES: kynureninase [unclassified Spirosoma]MBN8825534.1 kynureninase [Spirosoma sp.]OJW74214.1 MAG: kynureninase [Spirosoma sp. 48-14]